MKRIRMLGLCVLLVGVSACGDSPSSPSAAVQFRIDANTCNATFAGRTYTIAFFIDGASVGTATLGSGQVSPPFATSAGSHVFSASIANTGYRWDNRSFTVLSGQTFTVVMPC